MSDLDVKHRPGLYRRTKLQRDCVHSYMGWTHISDIDANVSSADDHPFAAPKQQPVVKVSVNIPTDDWLCRKMAPTQGYPSRSFETGGLQRDQHSKSHVKWYWLYPNQDRQARSVSSVHLCLQPGSWTQ